MASRSPHCSPHAADRWDERTAPDSVAPETAWPSAERRTDLDVVCRGDEVRLPYLSAEPERPDDVDGQSTFEDWGWSA